MNLSELQKQVKDMDEKFGWTDDTPLQNLVHIQEEVGEISRLLLGYEGYKKDEKFSEHDLSGELSDTLYLTLKLANHFDINLDKAWEEAKKRYVEKAND